MTLRANEIGADVYSTSETQLDKNNLDTSPDELEARYAYPELSPGRAVLDVETGTVYEIMHRVNGHTDTVEGAQSESEEYFNWKYNTPEGQDWGGIIQHHYISYAKRQCPTPNEHGEIQVPLSRPNENEITDVKPSTFENNVLFNDNDQSRPLLLLERAEITYEEVIPGDTYDILGWYDASELDANDRVKPTENISHQHPDIVGVDYETRTTKIIADLGIHIPWDDVSGTTTVQIAPGDGDVDYEVSTQSRTREFHISLGPAFGETRFLIDSPFDAKDDIKSIDAEPRWAPEQNNWALKANTNTLAEIIQSLTADGWTFTMEANVVDRFADTDITVVPEEECDVSITGLFDYTFTEEIEIGTGITIPGIDAELNASEIDDIAVLSPDGTIANADTASANHIALLADGELGFDCDKANASLVKSLDWKDARYEWNNEHGHWRVNADVAGDLIATFLENDEAVTAPVTILAELGTEESLTEMRDIDVDNDAATGLDSYSPNTNTDGTDSVTIDTNRESSATCEQLHGTAPSDPDRLSLMALDMSIADNTAQAGMSVTLSGGDLQELPASVKDEWQPSTTDDDAYGWYHPMTSARITVEETAGWGTEYDISVKEPNMDEPEHIITLADERMVVLTVITHLKSMTRLGE